MNKEIRLFDALSIPIDREIEGDYIVTYMMNLQHAHLSVSLEAYVPRVFAAFHVGTDREIFRLDLVSDCLSYLECKILIFNMQFQGNVARAFKNRITLESGEDRDPADIACGVRRAFIE